MTIREQTDIAGNSILAGEQNRRTRSGWTVPGRALLKRTGCRRFRTPEHKAMEPRQRNRRGERW